MKRIKLWSTCNNIYSHQHERNTATGCAVNNKFFVQVIAHPRIDAVCFVSKCSFRNNGNASGTRYYTGPRRRTHPKYNKNNSWGRDLRRYVYEFTFGRKIRAHAAPQHNTTRRGARIVPATALGKWARNILTLIIAASKLRTRQAPRRCWDTGRGRWKKKM